MNMFWQILGISVNGSDAIENSAGALSSAEVDPTQKAIWILVMLLIIAVSLYISLIHPKVAEIRRKNKESKKSGNSKTNGKRSKKK